MARGVVLTQNIGVAVVRSLSVHRAYLLNERDRLFLGLDRAEVADEFGLLFNESGFAAARDGLIFHESSINAKTHAGKSSVCFLLH